MAKDKRLYMTFPNDFWMHPKIAPLTVEAKWAFVEMNGYSRMQDLDGRIPAVMIQRMWTSEVVLELCASHAERPLMFHDEPADEYVIRDYAAHQQTTADREETAKKRSDSGKLGADARWNGKPLASAMANEWQTDGKGMAETETETETETTTTSNEVVERSATRGSRLSPEWLPNSESIALVRDNCPGVDAKAEHPTFVDYWISQPGQKGVKTNWDATWRNWMRRKQSDLGSRQAKPSKDVRALSLIEQGRAMDEADARKELSA
jgi:hypothetical protein